MTKQETREELLYWLENQSDVHGYSNAELRRMSDRVLQDTLDNYESELLDPAEL